MTEPTDTPTSTISDAPDAATLAGEHAEPGGQDIDAIRELVLRAHPDVVPELIGGDTVEEMLASVAPAEAAYQRLAERLGHGQAATPPVPAGGDRPMPVDPARLPASEKIRRGLSRASR